MNQKQLDLRKIEWVVDPIQDDYIKEKMAVNSAFAEALMKNKTQLFFEFLHHKPAWREPITLEFKGQTRSGKSTFATGVCKYVSNINQVPFPFTHISPNETIYLEKMRVLNAPEGSCFQIDEQTETHAGAGSYTEMQLIEDITNITAKKCYNTSWAHPHEFVGRMSQIGIELFGKNPDLLLLRGIMYNLAQKSLTNTPIGIVIFPVGWLFPCGIFGKKIRFKGEETIITCNKLVCPQYKNCKFFMGQYEHQKDVKIEEVLSQSLHDREIARLQVIEKIANNPVFQKAKKLDEKMSVARLLVPFGTPEKLILEFCRIAKSSNISVEDLRSLQEEQTKIVEEIE